LHRDGGVRLLFACALLPGLALGCASGAGDISDTGQADASSAGPAVPDAGQKQEGSQADAAPPAHVIGRACGPDSSQALRLAVAPAFQAENPCFPQPGVDAVIITLHLAQAAPDQTVQFSGGSGGGAYFCPANEDLLCEAIAQGEVTFDDYEHGSGASGIFSLKNAEIKGEFHASWCDTGCTD
jgi:hypothetical protein